MYFAILLCIDNGPCKHICNIVEGNVVCSCLPGYTIMADGISCEGKWFRFTTETWLKHFYIDLIDLIPLGVSLRVLYFQYCELQVSVQRPFARRNTRSASQITPEARLSSVPITWGLQVKASLDLYVFLWHSGFFQPFRFLFPLPFLPRVRLVNCGHAAFLPENASSEQYMGMFAVLRNPLRATALPCHLFCLVLFLLALKTWIDWSFTAMKNVPLWACPAPWVSPDTEAQACTVMNSEFQNASWSFTLYQF